MDDILKNSIAIACLTLLTLTGFAHGATDGDIGARSTGQVIVRLSIEPGIQITNLKDIQLRVNLDSATSDAVYQQRFCVRGNLLSAYRMTAFSDKGGSTPFTLSSPRGDTLKYQLAFTGNLSSDVLEELLPAVPSQTYTLKHAGIHCDGQDNAEFKLTIPAAELQTARDSEYAGFLNLTVGIE